MSKVETALEAKRAELLVKQAERQAELVNKVEMIKLDKELEKLDSPLYTQRELTKQDNLTLDVIIDTISEQYAADNRKMSLVFGYGIIPSKILAICKSIQFSKHEEKQELLMLTGLDEQILEDVLDAFGNTAYFSKAAVEIVPAQPMDIQRVKDLLELVAIDMKLVSKLDLSKFNTANVKYQYDRAELKAQEMYDNTQEFLSEAATSYEE